MNNDTEACHLCGTIYSPTFAGSERGPSCPVCEVLFRVEKMEQRLGLPEGETA